jgi:uncharacterized glyoxalase superfamily protein PhnB
MWTADAPGHRSKVQFLAGVPRDACRIMAGECPDAIPPAQLGDHSYFGYLVVDDIDDLYANVSGAAAEIVKELATEPWGMREFGVRTVDGHRIMFGQEVT